MIKVNSLLLISFLNELELICLHSSSITIVFPKLNGLKYCFLTQTVLFNIKHMFADSESGTKYCYDIINNSIFVFITVK